MEDYHAMVTAERPSRLDNLDGVEVINGSLRISATKGLGDFSMEKLREITTEDEGPAIQISGNSGLRSLSFPALRRIDSPDDIKVTIVNNPKLGMKRVEVEAMYRLADGKRHTNIEFKDTSSLYDRVMEYKMFIIMVILILLIILLLALITAFLMATYIKRRREFTKDGFPTPPYRLDKDSKKILTGWVNEIISKNPLIWRCSDREVIWSYQKSDGTRSFGMVAMSVPPRGATGNCSLCELS
ncbi:unnamed protein product [Heligmosomoides polygyrus]|uniref:Recep_L_domain domain-containing protein n=1 Tax=Heligmosomoides polygyrus TaxID=6339 RepID=A0A183F542_HELPZ|nr:unnamed protein product [Heligmosomoides polygyrus]